MFAFFILRLVVSEEKKTIKERKIWGKWEKRRKEKKEKKWKKRNEKREKKDFICHPGAANVLLQKVSNN